MPSATDSSAFFDPSRAGSRSSNFQTLGQYSEFLRSAMADEESLQMGDNLQQLAVQVEATMVLLQQPRADAAAVAQRLLNLVEGLRGHRTLLLSLGGDWHHFYEFDAHFSVVNQFRIALTRWAMQAALPDQTVPPAAEFDLAAWRVLGAGAMLLDVYEQSRVAATRTAVPEPKPPVALTWWQRIRVWWRRPPVPQHEKRKSGRRGRRASD
ncbi:MAG: hypothetical protein IPH37_05850 [Burkholderiales bacterium]|nr:hypothetical protein [Burkholderiales bacterium]MBK9347324.1 hypothetical protein [Burkholderiales bacterium]